MTKNKASYELTFSEKSNFEAWMTELKKCCILTDFEQKYEIVKGSEKGKYVKVESKMGGNHYTAKVYDKSDPQTLILKNSILDEIKTLRALDYHRVIRIREVYEIETAIYLIKEFIHEKTLEKILMKSKWQTSVPKPETKSIMFSLLKTLAYIASQGIMHRNLKPANILMEDPSNTKIFNFSLAAFVYSPQTSFKTCGTPGYIAPEVLACEEKQFNQKYNNKCDVYSVGCIFFQMLFGFPLFGGSDASKILELNKDQNVNEFINKELKKIKTRLNEQAMNLLLKLLESDPRNRISAEQALMHPYFDVYNHAERKLMTNTDEPINSVDKSHLEKLLLLTPRSESRKSFATMSECSSSRDRSLEKPPSSFNSLQFETAPDFSSLPKFTKMPAYTSRLSEKSRFHCPSPRNERSSQNFLKAAIFCNIKNQAKNGSEFEIKSPNLAKLNKRSCSESIIAKVEHIFSGVKDDDGDSDDICDEGLDEIKTNYRSFFANRQCLKLK